MTDVSGRSATAVNDVNCLTRTGELLSDLELIALAEKVYKDEQVMEASRLLRQVQDKSLLTTVHEEILSVAVECEELIADLLLEPDGEHVDDGNDEYNDDDVDDNNNSKKNDNDSINCTDGGWIKMGESHGKRDTFIYYKHPEGYSPVITCRLETPVEASLLIPLLSVLNETDLFHTWVPYWPTVNIGLHISKHMKQCSRVNQILFLNGPCPWPFSSRQLLLKSIAVDEIISPDHDGYIAVTLRTVHDKIDPVENSIDGIPLPAESVGAVYADFNGTFLFRPCPTDHPILATHIPRPENESYPDAHKHFVVKDSGNFEQSNNSEEEEHVEHGSSNIDAIPTEDEPKILVSFKMMCDPHMTGVPTFLINFVLKKGIGIIWYMLLKVADEVKSGKRPEHMAAIKAKPEIYQFIQDRVTTMVQKLEPPTTKHEGEKKVE